MSSTSPLTVLQSFRAPRRTTNPYLSQLVASLPDDVTVRLFTWPNALLRRYDVLHAHWPELLCRGSDRRRTAMRQILFGLLLIRVRISGIAVVRTAHNVGPHEPGRRCERLLLGRLDRLTSLWITLTDVTPLPPQARRTTIAHGHYRDWYATYAHPPPTPGRLTYFGLIRPYKRVLALCTALAGLADPEVSLRIVGQPSTTELGDRIREACARDPRISARLDYVDEADLAREIGAAELVVLPYADMHNSGALLLALSLGRPVLAPDTPSTAALAAEIGTEWLLTYPGDISPKTLRDSLIRARSPRPAGPDLSARDWAPLGLAHRDAYLTALRHRKK